jgi:restriction system protein
MVDRGASAAKVVATTSFTSEAIAFAKGKPIELVDSNALLRLVRDVQKSPRVAIPSGEPDHLTPACPQCGATMVVRTARRGRDAGSKFWGCPSYPKCRGTRPL